MTVISVSIPARRYPVLTNVALKYGVQADRIDIDEQEQTVYVDLHAEPHRALRVGVLSGATFLAFVDEVEHSEVIKSRPVHR